MKVKLYFELTWNNKKYYAETNEFEFDMPIPLLGDTINSSDFDIIYDDDNIQIDGIFFECFMRMYKYREKTLLLYFESTED